MHVWESCVHVANKTTNSTASLRTLCLVVSQSHGLVGGVIGDTVAGSAVGADEVVLLRAVAAAADGVHCCGGHIVSKVGTVGFSMSNKSKRDSPCATVMSLSRVL